MASRGQRFTLNPDADDFAFDIRDDEPTENSDDAVEVIKEIREREPTGIPPPPKSKEAKTGFPRHRNRGDAPAFGLQPVQNPSFPSSLKSEPSDQAILTHLSRKYGIDPEAREKAEIGAENNRRIAQMSVEDIEQARSEIMSSLSPAYIERFLKRANLEEDQEDQNWEQHHQSRTGEVDTKSGGHGNNKFHARSSRSGPPSEGAVLDDEQLTESSPKKATSSEQDNVEAQFQEVAPSIHFPVPKRNPDDYVPLDPDSPSFLTDLKKHYFPDLPEDPSTLAWLRDPTEEESKASSYAPTQTRYAPSDIRFDFTGRLLAPNESREVPISKGLHHHGEAPESAGYTIPELSILARSSLPNQRCVAYQVLGRILYRLGRGDFGPRGSELQEGLWTCVEKERPLEFIMSEANRTGGHVSAKAYATEALWLWRKGGGGERGILKPGETIAK